MTIDCVLWSTSHVHGFHCISATDQHRPHSTLTYTALYANRLNTYTMIRCSDRYAYNTCRKNMESMFIIWFRKEHKISKELRAVEALLHSRKFKVSCRQQSCINVTAQSQLDLTDHNNAVCYIQATAMQNTTNSLVLLTGNHYAAVYDMTRWASDRQVIPDWKVGPSINQSLKQ